VRAIPSSEIADFGWTEIKDGKRSPKLRGPAIVLPPERTKNKRKHSMPLSDPAPRSSPPGQASREARAKSPPI